VEDSVLPNWTHERAKVAALTRDRAPDDPTPTAARRALLVGRCADLIRRSVADPPPNLTAPECDELAALVTGAAR
jgi:hypothetical protein